MGKEKRLELETFAEEQKLNQEHLEKLVTRYELSDEMPLRDDFAGVLETNPTYYSVKKYCPLLLINLNAL